MSYVPVSVEEIKNPERTKKYVNIDLSFMLPNDSPNPMFEEMHKTIYSILTMILGITSLFILLGRIIVKDPLNDVDLIGETSAMLTLCYMCIQSKICQDIIEIEENRGIENASKQSEANRVYIVLSGCGGAICMLVYVISCQMDSKAGYHVAGVFLYTIICFTIFSAYKIKEIRNYILFISLGEIYFLALVLIVK